MAVDPTAGHLLITAQDHIAVQLHLRAVISVPRLHTVADLMVALHPHLHMVEGVQCLLTEVERRLTAEVAPACLRHRTVVDTLVVDLEAAAMLAASVAADTRPPVADLTAAVVAEDTMAVEDTMAMGTTELPIG